jgi:hypothetical protein
LSTWPDLSVDIARTKLLAGRIIPTASGQPLPPVGYPALREIIVSQLGNRHQLAIT